MSGYLRAIPWLLSNGLSITDIDASGRTALLLAVEWKKVQSKPFIFLLDECGASIAETDGNGWTAWSIALDELESSFLEQAGDEEEVDIVPETLSVILALCDHTAPPRHLDQLLTYEHIAPGMLLRITASRGELGVTRGWMCGKLRGAKRWS
jgi:ankyrin repeat protein